MEISIGDAWAHRNQKSVQCPDCGSDRMRLSRRTYDGIVASVLQLQPMKCADCGAYVPIAAKFLAGSGVEHDSLSVSFQSVNWEGKGSPLGDFPIATRNQAVARGACPICGSRSVRPTTRGPLESYVSRFSAKQLYRCATCNASFRQTNLAKLAVMALMLVALLAVLTKLGLTMSGHLGPSTASPRLKGPAPATSPPVFR